MKRIVWPAELPVWEKWVEAVAADFVRSLNDAAVRRFRVRAVAKAAVEALKRKGQS